MLLYQMAKVVFTENDAGSQQFGGYSIKIGRPGKVILCFVYDKNGFENLCEDGIEQVVSEGEVGIVREISRDGMLAVEFYVGRTVTIRYCVSLQVRD